MEKAIPEDYQKKLDAWKKKFKDKWDYQKKLIVIAGEDGQVITPTTSTSTIPPTTTSRVPNTTEATPRPTSFTPVVTIDNITEGGITDSSIAQADTTQLIKIVGITCAALIGLIILLLLIIRLWRGSNKKRNQRISLRRPLNSREPEEHIYAEIEPLQAQRGESTDSSRGATGGMVQLPSRKDKRKRGHGISSFRALSTRIYRFFNVDHSDDQSVFYNRTNQNASVINEVPEPPERNTANGSNRRGRGVQRFESTASRRPLLDGDSVISTTSLSAEMRNNIYNPLLRDTDVRNSGPYEDLASKRGQGAMRDSEASIGADPETPHDYFTLEKEAAKQDSEKLNGHGATGTDYMVLEKEKKDMDTIIEEETPPPKIHDYFVLEPHEKVASGSAKKSPAGSPTKTISGSASPVKEPSSPTSPGQRPVAKPRVTKGSSLERSPVKTVDSTTGKGENKYDNNDSSRAVQDQTGEKDDVYVLEKLGDAPEPPETVADDDYLSPTEVKKTPDYVDVSPNPPPRSTSLRPGEEIGAEGKGSIKRGEDEVKDLGREGQKEPEKNEDENTDKVINTADGGSPSHAKVTLKTSTETEV